MMRRTTRRSFLKRTAGAAGTIMVLPSRVLGQEGVAPPSDKLKLAFIGAGGRGRHNLNRMKSESIVALCDVDEERAAESFDEFPKIPKYKDFRVMLDKHDDVDGVVISTPDHTHAVAAMNAIKRGKHVYVEKPLAHDIREVRTLLDAAHEQGIVHQLGNQGHSFGSIRRVCEWLWAGAIGHVHEVHVWFGLPRDSSSPPPSERPKVPPALDWDLWLGPVPYRPYHPVYLPGTWRYWDDFGTGLLGDWTCHVLDPAFWALQLRAPEKIVAYNVDNHYSPERFPIASTVEFYFPARTTMPPVKVMWTFGRKPKIPQVVEAGLESEMPDIGGVLIGDKGFIAHGSHGGGGARIVPEERAEMFSRAHRYLPRIEGNHHQEWLDACKEGRPADSHFAYGGPLTEVALLGVIATKYDREILEWDNAAMRFKNHSEANEWVQREYRSGWSL